MSTIDFLGMASRWVHIVSAVILLGGLFFARFALAPAGQTALLHHFRPASQLAILGLLASGVYNLLIRKGAGSTYHMVFGFKFLLALHVMGVALILVSRPAEEVQRSRMIRSIVVSGLLLLGASAYLGRLSGR